MYVSGRFIYPHAGLRKIQEPTGDQVVLIVLYVSTSHSTCGQGCSIVLYVFTSQGQVGHLQGPQTLTEALPLITGYAVSGTMYHFFTFIANGVL